MTGGRTRDGGSIVGASVFYSDPPPEERKDGEIKTEVGVKEGKRERLK